jgi:hypothetical protein
MAGADDATGIVLDLQHGQTHQAHRPPGEVEKIGALIPPPGRRGQPEAIVGRDLPLERRQPVAKVATAIAEIVLDDLRQGHHPPGVLIRHPAAHLAPDSDGEKAERHEDHERRSEEDAGAQAHGVVSAVESGATQPARSRRKAPS